MKFTTQIAETEPNNVGRRQAAKERAKARALRRYDRAMNRLARAERVVERSLSRVRSAEATLIELVELVDDVGLREAQADDRTMARDIAPDVLAMAHHDLRIAVRRHADAARQVSHRYAAIVSASMAPTQARLSTP